MSVYFFVFAFSKLLSYLVLSNQRHKNKNKYEYKYKNKNKNSHKIYNKNNFYVNKV